MLALKVALSSVRSTPTLIFDEIDSGTGGAVADAIGQRLNLLGKTAQVLVVTHLPQPASPGDQTGHGQEGDYADRRTLVIGARGGAGAHAGGRHHHPGSAQGGAEALGAGGMTYSLFVIPAKAGISSDHLHQRRDKIPAGVYPRAGGDQMTDY